MERFSTSPLRKSACVAAWKNFGEEALKSTPPRNTPPPRTLKTRRNVFKGCLLGDRNGERLRAGDCVFGRQLPFAERGVGQRVETAAAAVAFEHAEDRRRERRQRLAFDNR